MVVAAVHSLLVCKVPESEKGVVGPKVPPLVFPILHIK